jgi:hypothetical protein
MVDAISPTLPADFPLQRVAEAVWGAVDIVEHYCRHCGKVETLTEYLALEAITDAVIGMTETLDELDPQGADRRAHAFAAGCPTDVSHDRG